MCYVHSLVLYRVTLCQFSVFACCRIFGAGISSFAASVGLIVLFLFDSYVTNKVIYLTYCLHVLRSFPRAFILSHCDDSQLAFFCLDCTCKTCPWSPIFVSFPLVFLSPRANTHHCPHINLCAPIRNHPYLICFFVYKT